MLQSLSLLETFQLVFNYATYWLPVFLIYIAAKMWLQYRNAVFLNKIEWKLFEIKIPKEVHKSPQAMEMFFSSALTLTSGMGTWRHEYVVGNLLYWTSLEIASFEGEIRFFMRVPVKFAHPIEVQLYAQYPDVVIAEVEDYTNFIPHYTNNSKWDLWGTEFRLKKPDCFPIKTYIDYGLDKAVGSLDENQRVDPLASLLEYMGSIGSNQQVWFQILVKAHRKRYIDPTKKWWVFDKRESWKILAQKQVIKIKDVYKVTNENGKPEFKLQNMSDQEKLILYAIQRSVDKPAFDCIFRTLYIYEKDSFTTNAIVGVLASMKQFNTEYLNAFSPHNTTDFDHPWQDPTGNRLIERKKNVLKYYRERSGFYKPESRAFFTMNSEELATIYHIPGTVIGVPTLRRIESVRGQPPANLPT